jgi:hypothetical protein
LRAVSGGWGCLLLAEGGDVQLEQLDEAGREWFGEGPAGVAVGSLDEVIANAAAPGAADTEWIAAVVEAVGRELVAGLRRSMLLVKRGSGVMFHASRSANRESIRRHGLDWRRMGETPGIAGSDKPEWPGIFLCSTLEDARWFAGMNGPGPADIWSARVDGIWLEGAPDASGGGDDGWMISPIAIAPQDIELVETEIRPMGR